MSVETEVATDTFLIEFIPEDDGTFSAIVLNLPGAGSCGDTEAEALENVREALTGVMEEYAESGEGVPWIAPADVVRTVGRRSRWIRIDG